MRRCAPTTSRSCRRAGDRRAVWVHEGERADVDLAVPPRGSWRSCSGSSARAQAAAQEGRRPGAGDRAAPLPPRDRGDRRRAGAGGDAAVAYRGVGDPARGRPLADAQAAATASPKGPAPERLAAAKVRVLGDEDWPGRGQPSRPSTPACSCWCPELVALDLPGLVEAAGWPSTSQLAGDPLGALAAGAQALGPPAAKPRAEASCTTQRSASSPA